MANDKVKFIDTSKEVKQTMQGLAKSALRESGKVVRKILRDSIRSTFKSKKLPYHVASWAKLDIKTGQPQLEIGYYSWQRVKKRGKIPSRIAPHWVEFGTNSHQIKPKNAKALGFETPNGGEFFGTAVTVGGIPAQHILKNAVYNNVNEIKAAQSEYLEKLNLTIASATGYISKGDEPEDD